MSAPTSCPAILYHYCSTDSFLNILRSAELWLSHTSGMNDSKEMQHVQELADDLLNTGDIPAQYLDTLSKAKTLSRKSHGDVYLACFSEDPDCLSQWRGYADDGAGFCIGFDPRSLPMLSEPERVWRDLATDEFLFKVSYDREAIVRRLRALFLSPKNAARKSQTRWIRAFEIDRQMESMSFVFKAAAFIEEREWRVVYWPGKEQEPAVTGPRRKFRNSRYGLIPYFTHTLKNKASAIREVLLGPKNPSEERFVQAYLNDSGYENVSVRRSAATYR